MGCQWKNWVGHKLIKSVEVEIGGQRIDKHSGDWMHIWNELTQTAGHQQGYADMVGNTPELTLDNTGDAMMLFIPLNLGSAETLVSLYH